MATAKESSLANQTFQIPGSNNLAMIDTNTESQV